jgi:hypothetical protein
MTTKITKENSKHNAQVLLEKLKKKPKKGNLAGHFGKLKRNIDGLAYQISARENDN